MGDRINETGKKAKDLVAGTSYFVMAEKDTRIYEIAVLEQCQYNVKFRWLDYDNYPISVLLHSDFDYKYTLIKKNHVS